MQRRRDRELSFSDLPQMEMDKLCVVDHYPSDRFTFSSHGYDLHIENELVADAFAGLSVQEQSILILHFVLDLPDQEVGRLVGMSRSAVQRRRAKSLTELRIKLGNLAYPQRGLEAQGRNRKSAAHGNFPPSKQSDDHRVPL